MKGKAAEKFEDLHIYQRSRELVNAVYTITRDSSLSRDFGFTDQIRRAAVSVVSNIAEGFERGSKTEFIQFLYIAKGSCGEVRAQLQIAYDLKYIDDVQYNGLYKLAQQIGAMISNFIGYLQTSDYQGEKVSRPKRLAIENDKKKLQNLYSKFGYTPKNYDEQE